MRNVGFIVSPNTFIFQKKYPISFGQSQLYSKHSFEHEGAAESNKADPIRHKINFARKLTARSVNPMVLKYAEIIYRSPRFFVAAAALLLPISLGTYHFCAVLWWIASHYPVVAFRWSLLAFVSPEAVAYDIRL